MAAPKPKLTPDTNTWFEYWKAKDQAAVVEQMLSLAVTRATSANGSPTGVTSCGH